MLSVAVILYNPEQIGIEQVYVNIMSYAEFINKQYNGRVYLIDNSPLYSQERESYLKTIPGSFYYHNKNQGGIAGAQNFACNKAIQDGYEWIMTMDQDSNFEKEDLDYYLQLFTEWQLQDSSAKSFTPRVYFADGAIPTFTKLIRFKILSPIKRIILRQKNLQKAGTPVNMHDWKGPEIEYPTLFVPASANIINLKIWEQLGKFDESLIIDQVDNDFNIRLTDAGYKIIKFNKPAFSHYLGEKKFTIFNKHTPHYNSFRLYYIFRNHLIMINRYPKYQKEYKKILKYFIIENCIFNWKAISNIFLFLKAYKDYQYYVKQDANNK